MAVFLRFALLPVLLLGLTAWSLTSPPPQTAPQDMAAGMRHLMLATALKSDDPAAALHQNAVNAALLARTTDSEAKADYARMQARASVAALCDLENAASLPWKEWFLQQQGKSETLSKLFFVYGCRAQAQNSLEWAKELDLRTTPTDLRLAAHAVLWQHDAMLAKQRGQRLVRESPRGNEALHARYVDEVLTSQHSDQCESILLAIAHREGLDSRARNLAIEVLVERDAYHLAADMVTLYRASTGDLMVRKSGLLAALALDPELGKQALMNDIPDKANHPGLYNLVRELRQKWDLPPLP